MLINLIFNEFGIDLIFIEFVINPEAAEVIRNIKQPLGVIGTVYKFYV